MEKIMLTADARHMLRERIRYRKKHICIIPKYVVEGGNSFRYFSIKDLPKYIISQIRKLF